MKQISGESVSFVQGDIRDKDALNDVFAEHEFDAVIYFAGLKAVGESVAKPIMYSKTMCLAVYSYSRSWLLMMLRLLCFHPQQRFMVIQCHYHLMKQCQPVNQLTHMVL